MKCPLSLICLFYAGTTASFTAAEEPNIVFVMIDDLEAEAEAVGCYARGVAGFDCSTQTARDRDLRGIE